jgi:hypothetical protein
MSETINEVAFWAKVDRSGDCWLWTASTLDGGFGKFGCVRNGKRNQTIGAHRASWLIHYGTIPENMYVSHKCGKHLCVNPAHLCIKPKPGKKDRDVLKRERKKPPHGEASPHARLKDADVARVFELRKAGMTQRQIADIIGCTAAYVSMILAGKASRQRWGVPS